MPGFNPRRSAQSASTAFYSKRLSEEEIERLWVEEAERRLEAYRRGETTAIPYEEVLDKIHQKLGFKS